MIGFLMIAGSIFQSILNGLGAVLAKIYDIIPSYGVAIMILTMVIRLILVPVGVKQVRSMRSMQSLQPQIKKLQAKYKGNKQKLNEETMKLYQENGVNPLASCFPLLFQIPVFICLYAVLRPPLPGVDNHIPVGSSLYEAVVVEPHSGTDFLGMNLLCSPSQSGNPHAPAYARGKLVGAMDAATTTMKVQGQFTLEEPGFLITIEKEKVRVVSIQTPGDPDKNIASAVTVQRAADGTTAVGHPTGKSAVVEVTTLDCGNGTPSRIPYFVLLAAMVLTMFLSSRQMQKASPAAIGSTQQQKIMKYLPLFFGIFFFQVASGLIVYWTTSNSWQMAQQYFLLRGAPKPLADGGGSGGGRTKRKPGGGSGGGGGTKTIEAKGTVKDGQKGSKPGSGSGQGQRKPPQKSGAGSQKSGSSKGGPRPKPKPGQSGGSGQKPNPGGQPGKKKPSAPSKPSGFMARMIEKAEKSRAAKLNEDEGSDGGTDREDRS